MAVASSTGCLPHACGHVSASEKLWGAAVEKQGVLCAPLTSQTSPRASSAWSTQDGFVACLDPERDASIECSLDVACPSSWPPHLQGRLDQDCDATCTSRSSDLFSKHDSTHSKVVDGAPPAVGMQQAAARDSSAQPDTSRIKLQRFLNPVEQQRLRAARQLEDLVAMIRNEQVLEQEVCPSSGFLEQQDAAQEQPITPQMLMIVSSWLAEVAFEFSMQQETLFLAVALLGRFLDASTGVPRGVLQLVAVACMMLAAKQDEVVHPTVQELTDIAANCFTAQDLLRMERILLDSLNWRVKTPTAYTFLHLFTQSTAAMRAAGGIQACAARAAGPGHLTTAPQDMVTAPHTSDPLSGLVVAKAAYLTELALLDYGMLSFKPSQVAAAALLLSESWSSQGAAVDEMHAISGYNSGDLQECMARLLRLHQFAEAAEGSESLTPLVFIKEKYAQECWLKASMQPTPQPGIVGAGGAAAGAAAPYAAGSVSLDGAVHHHGAAASSSQCTSLLPAAGCHDAVAPMEM